MKQTLAPLILAAVLLATTSGCHQGRLLAVADTDAAAAAQAQLLLPDSAKEKSGTPEPPDKACTVELGQTPPADAAAAFTTVLHPDLPKRPIALVECVALALENGRTGDFFDNAGGNAKTSVAGLSRQASPSQASDSIRVFAFDPAIAATDTVESQARFDVFAQTNLFWNRIDQPSRFLVPPTPSQEFFNRNKVDNVSFESGLFQRLPAGGAAGVKFRTDFQDNFLPPDSGILNPAYQHFLEFSFEQPLLQGSGLLVNQLRDFHPGSILLPNFPDAGKAPGIVLARIGHKQTQLEFERRVQELLYRVEEAYWNLYGAYWDLYASDNGMKQALAAWQIARARFDAGGIGIEDLALVEEQVHFFRSQRLQALGRGQPGQPGVLEAERRLRYVLGLPPEDGTRLVPAEELTFVPYQPDLKSSIEEARWQRPELRQVDEEIRAAQLGVLKAEDRVQPDLRFVSRYDVNGLGNTYGSGFQNLAERPHHEWEVGLRLVYPIGFRAGYAETTRAKLLLAQRLAFLHDQQTKLLFSLQRSYRDLVQYQEQYQIRQSQRQVAELQLRARYQKFKAGGDPKQPGTSLDLLLRAQRNWADALREEHVALCHYRTAIADFERQRGTICQYANVQIEEGTVPGGVIPQASRYLRHWSRTLAQVHPELAAGQVEAMASDQKGELPAASTKDRAPVTLQTQQFVPMGILQPPMPPGAAPEPAYLDGALPGASAAPESAHLGVPRTSSECTGLAGVGLKAPE